MNLEQITRPPLIEPSYTSAPRYCLLVIGERCDTAIWIVACDDAVFVDVKCDGDITRAGSRIPLTKSRENSFLYKFPELPDRTGRVHKKLHIWVHHGHPSINVGIEIDNGHSQVAAPTTTDSSKTAPIIHFDGLLEFGFVDANESLAETIDNELCIATQIGTPGIGHCTFSPIALRDLPSSAFPTATYFVNESRHELALADRI